MDPSRRGLLRGALALAGCLGCGVALASGAEGRARFCGEGLSADQISDVVAATPPPPAPATGRRPAVASYAFPAAQPVVTIRYHPDDLMHRAPEDALGSAGRRVGGAPEHVHQAALAAATALRVFRDAGFLPPFNPGGGPLRIELRNIIPFRGFTAPEPGDITIERTLRGTEQAETIAHELFHRVQYSYNRTKTADAQAGTEDLPRFLPMLREGGARLAELMVVPGSQRYENDAQDWFMGEPYSLARVRRAGRRGFAGASYQAGLFWKYIAEQHGSTAGVAPPRPGQREAETQRILLEQTRAPGDAAFQPGIEALRQARAAMRGPGGFDQFQYIPGLTDAPVVSETSWGNFQLALVLNGTAGADARFRFDDAPAWRGITARGQAIAAARQRAFDSLPAEGGAETLRFGPALAFEPEPGGPVEITGQGRMLAPFSMMTFRVTLPADGETRLLKLDWAPLPGLVDAMVQVATLDQAGELLDLHRHDGSSSRPLAHVYACRGAREVLILVGSRTTGGDFVLRLARGADRPVLLAAGCNGRSGRYLTRDPVRSAFDWLSPDIRAFPGDGPFRDIVQILVLNRGTLPAEQPLVVCRYAPAANPPARLADWGVMEPRGSRPARLATDAECARLEAEPATGTPLPPPCYFTDEVSSNPQSPKNTGVFSFGLREGGLRDMVLRFEISAPGAPALVTYAAFNGRGPRLSFL